MGRRDQRIDSIFLSFARSTKEKINVFMTQSTGMGRSWVGQGWVVGGSRRPEGALHFLFLTGPKRRQTETETTETTFRANPVPDATQGKISLSVALTLT